MNNPIHMDIPHPTNQLPHNLIAKYPIDFVPLPNIIGQAMFAQLHLYIHNRQKPKIILLLPINTKLPFLFFHQLCALFFSQLGYWFFCGLFRGPGKTKSIALIGDIGLLKLWRIQLLLILILILYYFDTDWTVIFGVFLVSFQHSLILFVLVELSILQPARIVLYHIRMRKTVEYFYLI